MGMTSDRTVEIDKSHTLERLVWQAMSFGYRNGGRQVGEAHDIPPYTPDGNSDAELVARGLADDIRAAIEVVPAPDVNAAVAAALEMAASIQVRSKFDGQVTHENSPEIAAAIRGIRASLRPPTDPEAVCDIVMRSRAEEACARRAAEDRAFREEQRRKKSDGDLRDAHDARAAWIAAAAAISRAARAEDERDKLNDALFDALLPLRTALRVDIECCAVMTPAGPDMATLDEEDRALLAPTLAAIRTAEALIGRPEDEAPAWLDALIDGEGRADERA